VVDPARRFPVSALYTAVARSTGDGRNGHVRTDDALLDLDVRTPRALGGPGGATNPEQLFAAGFAACFHSALKLVGRQDKLDVSDSACRPSTGRPHRRWPTRPTPSARTPTPPAETSTSP